MCGTAKCSTKLSKRLRSRKVEAGKVVVRHAMFLSFAFDVLFILLLITMRIIYKGILLKKMRFVNS